MNFALIGYRGTGKTTIGQLLADRIRWPFVDTDMLITQRAGKTIQQIFAEGGEEAFRDLESAVLTDVLKSDNQVIALGGGAILRNKNVELLRKTAKNAWLFARDEIIFARICQDSASFANRPSLTALPAFEEIRHLLAVRTPLYAAAADVSLDVSALSPPAAADALLAALTPLLPKT